MSEISSFERWWLNAWPHRLHIKQYIPQFLRSCPEPFRGEVLEVGAGSGWTSQQILETFPQVELTATDVDSTATAHFDHLRSKYGQRLKVLQADVIKLPFDRASFDIVIAIHVLYHVGDVTQAIHQFLRVLRPGGLIGISEKDHEYFIGPLKWLLRSKETVSRQALEKIFHDEGCEIVQSTGEEHYTLWVRKPYPVAPAA